MTYLRLPEAGGGADPRAVARSVFGASDWRKRHPVLDVGECWQGLHYLLTGDPWEGPHPAADVVCGGRLLTEDGAEELGVDVIYLTADRVKLTADHLAATKFTACARRFDVKKMAQLGVQGAREWSATSPQAVCDGELRPAYDALTKFFGAAAAEGQAIYKAMG